MDREQGWDQTTGTQGLQKGEAQKFHKGETPSHHCPFPALGDFLGQGKVQWGDTAPPWSRNLGASVAIAMPGVTELDKKGRSRGQHKLCFNINNYSRELKINQA